MLIPQGDWIVVVRAFRDVTGRGQIRKQGTEEKYFPDEYTLMIRPADLQKVRVYVDGRIFVFNNNTCKYEEVSYALNGSTWNCLISSIEVVS